MDGNNDGFGSYLNLNGNPTSDEPSLDDPTEASIMRSYAAYLLPKAAEHIAGLFKLFWDTTHPAWTTPPPSAVTSEESFTVKWEILSLIHI